MRIDFQIRGDYIELVKLLKATGLCDSGGSAKVAMMQGRVMVDEQLERRKGCKVRRGQVVVFDGQIIEVV